MTKKDINYYMGLHYEVVVWQEDGDTVWFAKIPLLSGLMTHAETWEGLPAMIDEAKRGWLEVALEYGDPIPEPDPARA